MAIIEYDKSPNATPEQKIKSLADSVRRAFDEVAGDDKTTEHSNKGYGFYRLEVDENGGLWAIYPDGDSPPPFDYNAETGDLYIEI